MISIGANGNWFLDGVDSGVSAIGSSNAPRVTYKHVVIVGVDGGGAWFDDADMPNVDAIFAGGVTTDTCLASSPTISAPCWASILTGATVEQHGVRVNQTAYDNRDGSGAYVSAAYPTIFNLVQRSYPGAELAVFANWNGIKGLTESIGVHREFLTGSSKAECDLNTANAAAAYIQANQPMLTFIQLDSVDGAGEGYGFGSAEHLASLANVDTMIGTIYNAVAEAGMLEDTLFIVTADHGGTMYKSGDAYKGSHGDNSPGEYNNFLGLAGKSLLTDADLSAVDQRDIAAIVCWALGADGNPNWDAYIPRGLFGDNKTPAARTPAYALAPQSSTPASGSAALGNYVDLSTLKAGLFFDGNLTDLTGKTPDGVGNVTYDKGFYGSAVSVSAGNYVMYDDLTFGEDSFTIALWVKPGTDTRDDVSVYGNKSWSTGGATGTNLSWEKDYYFRFNAGNGAGTRVDSYSHLPANHDFGWVHTLLVVDRTAGTVSTYLNFEPVETDVLADGLIMDGACNFRIGVDGGNAVVYAFQGLLDDFLVFEGAMTESEIASLAAYYCGEAVEKTVTIPAAMAAYVNADKLRAGLTFDDYTVTDVVGTYDATVKGEATYVEGYNGVGYHTSVGNYISYEDLLFGNDSFAVAMWIKADSGNPNDPVLYGNQTWRNGQDDGFNFIWQSNSMLYFNAGLTDEGNGGKTYRDKVQTGTDYKVGEWIHTLVMVDRIANTVKIYANFELAVTYTLKDAFKVDGSSPVADHDLDSKYVFNIGMDGLDDVATNDSGKNDCFKGSIDDFLLFNDVLTDAEIAALAAYYAQ